MIQRLEVEVKVWYGIIEIEPDLASRQDGIFNDIIEKMKGVAEALTSKIPKEDKYDGVRGLW